jgi:hypothetical protein
MTEKPDRRAEAERLAFVLAQRMNLALSGDENATREVLRWADTFRKRSRSVVINVAFAGNGPMVLQVYLEPGPREWGSVVTGCGPTECDRDLQIRSVQVECEYAVYSTEQISGGSRSKPAPDNGANRHRVTG